MIRIRTFKRDHYVAEHSHTPARQAEIEPIFLTLRR
jgi:hypothetical protein